MNVGSRVIGMGHFNIPRDSQKLCDLAQPGAKESRPRSIPAKPEVAIEDIPRGCRVSNKQYVACTILMVPYVEVQSPARIHPLTGTQGRIWRGECRNGFLQTIRDLC